MISALLPSRGRLASLVVSVGSLVTTASRPENVEVLVMGDPDDIASIPAAWRYPAPRQVRAWIAPERYGYGRLHEYYNALAARAGGDWLLIWNDDATMLTDGWDEIIEAAGPAVLWLEANHSPQANMFPAWPRAWYEAAGRVSGSPHCDSWLQLLGGLLGQRRVPVQVAHHRADVTGEHADATYAEGRGLIGTDGYWPGGQPDNGAVLADALRIREVLHGRPSAV
jgi:hypothetical protein